MNTELGIYYENYTGFSANATLFHNRFKNKISSESIDDTTSTYTNVGKATTQGIELATTLPLWSEDWTLNMNYTFTDSEQKDGDNRGARLTNTPEHMANARLNWNVSDTLTTWLKAEYRGKTARFTQNYDNLSAANKVVYDNSSDIPARKEKRNHHPVTIDVAADDDLLNYAVLALDFSNGPHPPRILPVCQLSIILRIGLGFILIHF